MTAAPAESAAISLAPLHLRLFALLADYLLIVLVLNLGNQILLGPGWDLRPPPESPWAGLAGRFAWGTLLLLGKDAAFGLSPGKWLTGIGARGLADPPREPSRWALVLRNASLVLLPVEALLVFLDPHSRRLGDRIAGTIVIELPAPARMGRRLLVAAALLFASMLAGFLVAPWNMRRSAAYQEAARLVATDPAVAAQAGPGAVMGDSPGFDLELLPDGGRATFAFEAKGGAGQAKGRLELRLDRADGVWRRERLTLEQPGPQQPALEVKDAPEGR